MEDQKIDPEILEMCGYVRVHQIILSDGQATSFNLINGWDRLAVTSRQIGGEGSALPESREVSVWAVAAKGDSDAEGFWGYDITIHLQRGDLTVMASYSLQSTAREVEPGQLVALDPPTPMEMLAAQADAWDEE